MNVFLTEPVVSANAIVALVSALLVLGVSFGLPVTEDQKAAILGLVVIVAPFAAAWWARAQVTPLVDPSDDDGEALTRYDGMPSLRAQRQMNVEINR